MECGVLNEIYDHGPAIILALDAAADLIGVDGEASVRWRERAVKMEKLYTQLRVIYDREPSDDAS